MATLKQLQDAAMDLNSLYDENDPEYPPIKVNTKSTVAFLTEAITKVAADMGKGDSILEATADLLTELEIDVPAEVKIKKEKKEKAVKDKKEKSTKDKKEKVPGVISTIFNIVSDKGPITKEKILALLEKKFPDKDSNSMLGTIKVQLPGRMSKEKGVNIVNTEKGYQIQ